MPELLPLRPSVAPQHLESIAVLRRLGTASRALAELKGTAAAIPRADLLVNTLALQEAKDSSAIENIVTTNDEVYQEHASPDEPSNPATKEVRRYREALAKGEALLRETGLLTTNHIIAIQGVLKQGGAGLRRLPGTNLVDGAGNVVYTPPQDHARIVELMTDLEVVVNDPDALPVDPLLKMAVIHLQFECIQPFHDGNGRTGRILNVLYLVKEGLLDTPILYPSREILRTKGEYYRLLRHVHESGEWEPWLLYMMEVVERTARDALATVGGIKAALAETRERVRERHSFYSQDLVDHLFLHPYTRIALLQRDLRVSRASAGRYLDALAADGLLRKERRGRTNYYVNVALWQVLTRGEP